MRPAFSSTKQAAAFALLLLALLLSPVLAGKKFLPPRKEVYSSLTWRFGDYGFLDGQIYEETNTIDIAFIGSSRMWAGIDTSYVEKELSKKLGRPAVVRTLAWSWLGFDAVFFVTRDLLHNRKVRMIVIDDEYRADDVPHVSSTHLFRLGDDSDSLKGLPATIQSTYYFAAIMGMPRNMLSLVRPNLSGNYPSPDQKRWKTDFVAQNPNDREGALTVRRWVYGGGPYTSFIPHGTANASDACIYSSATAEQFKFAGPVTPPWQLEFAKKIAMATQESKVKLVFLHLSPVYSSNETNNPCIEERECWPEILNESVSMVGIAPAKLYGGVRPEDVPKFFYTPDFCHFNQNGEEFFTPLIAPALFHIYETETIR